MSRKCVLKKVTKVTCFYNTLESYFKNYATHEDTQTAFLRCLQCRCKTVWFFYIFPKERIQICFKKVFSSFSIWLEFHFSWIEERIRKRGNFPWSAAQILFLCVCGAACVCHQHENTHNLERRLKYYSGSLETLYLCGWAGKLLDQHDANKRVARRNENFLSPPEREKERKLLACAGKKVSRLVEMKKRQFC